MKLPILLLSLVLSCSAHAAIWPAKPVHFVVPVAAGSTTDIIPRVVAEHLSAQLGQPIVIQNQAGAGGNIGSAHVAKAEADGYTLLAHGGALTIAPALYSNLSFDPARDLVPVVPLGTSPSVLVVSPSSGYRKLADFIAAAKKRPGAFTFSSVGIGTATHVSAERFIASANIEVLHIPMKGGAEALTEVIAGRVDFFFAPVALALPHIREGKVVPLVVNGARRSTALPDVPTTGEAGLSDAEYAIWFGLFAPAKTPRDVIERLNEATLKALTSRDLKDRLAGMGVDPMPMRPDEFQAFVRDEFALNAVLVKRMGLQSK